MPFQLQDQDLKFILLGGFNAYLNGHPAAGFAYSKMRALVAYLAVEKEQDHRRDVLAELLWNDLDPAAARNNLRRTLADLRKALEAPTGKSLFISGKQTIRFIPDSYIDVLDFIEQSAALMASGDIDLQQAEKTIALYRGEFLSGLVLADCPDFEDWLQVQREKLHCRAVNLLERLSVCHGNNGDYGKALQYALRQTELAPWDEDAHCRTIRFYALSGQTGAAIRHYAICCRQLKNELGVMPNQDILQLVQRIRNGEFGPKVPEPLEPQSIDLPRTTERRQATVLYCALAFPALEDPEDWLEQLNAPLARCVEYVKQFSGHVVQAHGSGLLAYFGFPNASENAAMQAMQAALAITREIDGNIGIKVGIHTGLIITDTQASMMDLAGRTSKLAIQICNCVGYGEAGISRETHLIVSGYFDCVSLGEQSLPDFAKPIEIFKIIRESGAQTRLDAAATLTPLAGRKAEIAELLRLWDGIVQGECIISLIQGEAGIGKSRLLRILKERLAGQPHTIIELRCFPEISTSPFQALVAAFEDILMFSRLDSPETKLDKLATFIRHNFPQADPHAVPLLAQLLSLPLTERQQIPAASPRKQKQQISELLLSLLRALAARQPILLIAEDLHWIDPSTLELLALFVEHAKKTPVLALFTARPEFAPPWNSSLTPTLALSPLSEEAVLEMIASIRSDIPPDTARRIANRADGVPLFVEEMTKITDLNNHADIPATLHDLLMARMDRIGQAKSTAQLAATLGREFNLDLLQKVSALNVSQLRQMLGLLLNAGLMLNTGTATYQFKHALIQEAAYNSQTKAGRQNAHRLIAQSLVNDFPDIAENQPELIARHFEAAGQIRPAIDYWLKAVQRVHLYSSNVETVKYLEAGLKALDNLPAGIEKDRLEFALQVRFGFALQTTQGFGDAAALQAFYQAMELSKKIGNTPGLFQAQLGLCIGISSHPELGNNSESLKLCRQLLSMAQESGDPALLQQAHHVLGNTLFWMGRFAEARHHQEQAIALDPADERDITADDSGRITGVTSQAFLSWILWFQGFTGQAQQISQLSIERARQFDHPNTLCFILTFASALQRWLGNVNASLEFAEEGILLAQKMDFSIWLITNTMQRGWALAMQDNAEGVEQIRQCVDNMRMTMSGVIVSFSAPLAEALLHHGQTEEALAVLNETLAEGEKKHDYHFEAELHRLKGECLMIFSRYGEAEACFERALAISRSQSAKALELRSAISMARLWLHQGRQGEAVTLVDGIYRWFIDNGENADRQAAERLIGAIDRFGKNRTER
jgi:DNA-binding SARP family transcriptional activator/class 3 adenylate cyclase